MAGFVVWICGGAGAAVAAWFVAGDASSRDRDRRLYVATCVLALACAFLLALFPVLSEDLFMHLAVGRRFFATGHFPDPDPWLFSLPEYHRGWTDVWASHLLAYAIYRAGGFDALVFVKCGLVLLGAAAPLWLGRHLGHRSALVPAVLLLGLWAGSYRFLERASLVSDVASAWVLALCCAQRLRPSRARWILPGIFLLWTNLHPGVLVGLGFLVAAALTQPRRVRFWAPVLLAAFGACCVHPDGPRPLWYALQGILGGGFEVYRQSYFEFMPTLAPVYRGAFQVHLFGALLGATAATLVLAARHGEAPWFGFVCSTALAALGLSAVRFVTTASLALPVLVVAVSLPARRPRGWPFAAGIAIAALAAALCIRVATHGYRPLLGERHLGLGVAPVVAPEAAADFVAALPIPGRIFNEHSLGAYLAWRWDGNPKIYYHGYVLDASFYTRDYLAVNRSPAEFDRVVQQYDIDVFFLAATAASTQTGPLLHRLLLTRSEWALVYWDDVSMVFLRDRPATHALVERCAYRWLDPWRPERLAVGLRQDPERVRQEARRAAVHARGPRALSLLRQALPEAERPPAVRH